MPKRRKGRANGEGSIYEYPKGSGVWFMQIYLEDGRAKRHRAKSQRAAREKLRQLQNERDQGVNLSVQQPTVAQWCATWLEMFTINLRASASKSRHNAFYPTTSIPMSQIYRYISSNIAL